MRTKFICGNWKMNKTSKEAGEFVSELIKYDFKGMDVLIAPSFASLNEVNKIGKNKIHIAGQNICKYNDGAYTGEVSGNMLKEFCDYVIIGHSERRTIFSEDYQTIREKILRAFENDLKVILCLGENAKIREENKQNEFVKEEILAALENLEFNEENLTLAYEPIWAIGTGKTCSPEDAEDMCKFIREILNRINAGIGKNIRILYGGSVKGDNVKKLLERPDIDGALVGGASLKVNEFLKIINYKEN